MPKYKLLDTRVSPVDFENHVSWDSKNLVRDTPTTPFILRMMEEGILGLVEEVDADNPVDVELIRPDPPTGEDLVAVSAPVTAPPTPPEAPKKSLLRK